MKKLFFILLISFPFVINGQSKFSTTHSNQNLTCSSCHSCTIPTKENPCIKPCPRESMIRVDQKPEEGPRIIVIDKLRDTDIYAPVKFSHLAHAEMSDMTGGCRTCHHYNPPGNVIGCSDCHEVSRNRTDISKPDLKGAYHQQCMTCHRSWSGKTDCIECHAAKEKADLKPVKAKDEKAKRIHPEIKTPDKITYNTKTDRGKLVTFYHNDHTDLFRLECSKCHSNESCAKCHSQIKKPADLKITFEEQHKKCSNCHETKNNCNTCHSNKETERFNHKVSTGFDLSKFHSKLSCIRCHTTPAKFTGLNKDCVTCHGSWSWDNFNHKITGLVLDELHGEFDCESCHKEKSYASPSCGDCHDDKTYPKEKPGKLIKR